MHTPVLECVFDYNWRAAVLLLREAIPSKETRRQHGTHSAHGTLQLRIFRPVKCQADFSVLALVVLLHLRLVRVFPFFLFFFLHLHLLLHLHLHLLLLLPPLLHLLLLSPAHTESRCPTKMRRSFWQRGRSSGASTPPRAPKPAPQIGLGVVCS